MEQRKGARMLTIDEIKRFIQLDNCSARKSRAKVAQRYYDGHNDIEYYRLFYFDSNGDLKEDKFRTNTKISHGFFTELVDQKVQYLLSGDLPFIRSDYPELQEELDKYFDDDFVDELSDAIENASVTGTSYMYARKTEDDITEFSFASSNGIIEVRGKQTDDGCDYVIYWYVDRVTKDNNPIKRIQVWDTQQTYYYVEDENGEITLDESEEINPRPHILVEKKDGLYERNMGYIPFFRLDNNNRQTSDLEPVKLLIDDYDLMNCGLSNNITDMADGLYVVRGYEGQDLTELQQNIKTTKIVGVDSDGDVEIRTIDVPYAARQAKMEIDEKNIYKFGMGFNSAQIGDGNITNIVIKSRYALLDLKCDKFEKKLKKFLKQIIRVVIDEINEKNGTAYTEHDVYFDIDREVMTNALDNANIEKVEADTESVRVTTLLNAAATLQDGETVVQALCDIMDIDFEELKTKIDLTGKSPMQELDDVYSLLGGNEIEQTTEGSTTQA